MLTLASQVFRVPPYAGVGSLAPVWILDEGAIGFLASPPTAAGQPQLTLANLTPEHRWCARQHLRSASPTEL